MIKEIGPQEFEQWRKERREFVLLDVREPHEREISVLEGDCFIPLGEVTSRFSELPSDTTIVVYCRSGARSERAGEFLCSKGFTDVYNLVGGINGYAREVDPSLPIY